MIWGTMLGACSPISYYWNQYFVADAKGSCINVNLFFLIAGIINMLIDVSILSIPIPKILKLQMSRRRKITVMGIMLLGSFVCVASIVRIYYLVVLQTDIDLTWIMSPVFIWSSVEPAIGILSACLPVCGPLIRLVIHDFFTSNNESKSRGDVKMSSGWRNIGGSKKTGEDNLRTFGQGDGRFGKFDGRLRPEEDEIYLTNEASGGSDSRSTNTRDLKEQRITVKTDVEQTSCSRESSE